MSQTKVAVPTTTIQFNELQKPRKQRIKTKKLEKLKSRQVKKLEKTIMKSTDLPDSRMVVYRSIFNSMDSVELVRFQKEVSELKEGKPISHLDEYRKFEMATYNRDSLSGQVLGDVQNRTANELKEKYSSDYAVDSLRIPQDIPVTSLAKQVGVDTSGYDQIRYLSMSDSTISKHIEHRLENLVSEKIADGKLSELDQELVNPPNQIQQYIPGLEKYDYQKPELPKEKLDSAIIDQIRTRKIEEFKDGLSMGKAEDYEQKEGTLKRFAIGGYMRYDAGKNAIELTPSVSYAITPRLSPGVGYQTNISLSGSDSLNTRGVRLFADYVFYDNWFVHAESEWISRNSGGEGADKYSERNTYMGIGRAFQYRFLKTSVTALYNFNAPSELHQKKFTIRIGFTISK